MENDTSVFEWRSKIMKVMFIKDWPEHTKEEIPMVHNMNKGAWALLIIFHMDIKKSMIVGDWQN